jgi:predicted secreted protein
MRKAIFGAALVIIGTLAVTSLALTGATARSERSINKGSSWEFHIQGNPSTGYVWRLNKGKSENLAIVKVEDLGYGAPEAQGKKKLGRPAPYRFRITGLSPGFAKLHFEYLRPWVGDPKNTEDLWARIE